mmetsp:Transcript_52758/g.115701  ORF Transcript_52758/g.115701 Transcript_52758/m.115701 type:complete len:201 (-) Transcript_52758:237-839(-)
MQALAFVRGSGLEIFENLLRLPLLHVPKQLHRGQVRNVRVVLGTLLSINEWHFAPENRRFLVSFPQRAQIKRTRDTVRHRHPTTVNINWRGHFEEIFGVAFSCGQVNIRSMHPVASIRKNLVAFGGPQGRHRVASIPVRQIHNLGLDLFGVLACSQPRGVVGRRSVVRTAWFAVAVAALGGRTLQSGSIAGFAAVPGVVR